jgi:transposase-like protein
MDYGVSAQQLAVICALSSGATIADAAQQAGVHRNTLHNWRRNSLPFQHALAHAQYDRALYFREKVEDLVELALQSLQELLTDPKTPASVRLKAALAIIATASTPPAPLKQVELDIEKIVVKKSQPSTITGDQLAPAPPVHKDAQPAAGTSAPGSPVQPPVHKDAQPQPPKIGMLPDQVAKGQPCVR